MGREAGGRVHTPRQPLYSLMKKKIYLIRHGETAWTLSGQHTGITDVTLTPNGETQGRALGARLKEIPFTHILCSPLKRATQTCALAHYLPKATIDEELREWNYGDYEGLTTAEIWKTNPQWSIFSNGAPHGESVQDIQIRAEKVLTKLKDIGGNIALFSHGHFLRALAACWLRFPIKEGRHLALSPGSLSILGYERETPVLLLWNEL